MELEGTAILGRFYVRKKTVNIRLLMCGSAAARLLGLRVRIPSEAWMSVSCNPWIFYR